MCSYLAEPRVRLYTQPQGCKWSALCCHGVGSDLDHLDLLQTITLVCDIDDGMLFLSHEQTVASALVPWKNMYELQGEKYSTYNFRVSALR